MLKENTSKKDFLFNRSGVIGRFRPFHNGAAIMLEAVCKNSSQVVIGIGSSNKYDLRNPFTPDEVEDMINLFLSKRFSNYQIVRIPDSGHIPEFSDGSKWVSEIKNNFGDLEVFVTGNDYVKSLLEKTYKIVHPSEIIPENEWVYIKGSMVRDSMAKGDEWKTFVPLEIVNYLESEGLVDRFRKEFGLQTIANSLINNPFKEDNKTTEKIYVVGGKNV